MNKLIYISVLALSLVAVACGEEDADAGGEGDAVAGGTCTVNDQDGNPFTCTVYDAEQLEIVGGIEALCPAPGVAGSDCSSEGRVGSCTIVAGTITNSTVYYGDDTTKDSYKTACENQATGTWAD